MSIMKSLFVSLWLAVLTATACFANDAEPPKFYRLDFVVKEIDGGKTLNGRSYWVVAGTGQGGTCSIRTGSKVPVPTAAAAAAQYTFIELGVNIDCRLINETGGSLALYVNADISTAPQESLAASSIPPIIRQNKWSSGVTVPLRKATAIFSSDDVTGKHQMQLELTATPIT